MSDHGSPTTRRTGRKRRRLGKVFLACLLTPIAILTALNIFFVTMMEVSEREWLGETPETSPDISARSKKLHHLQLLDHGPQSLRKRLELIRSAKASIAMEFFIYELDSASRIITSALIEKAKSGVQVRILVDFAAPVFKLAPAYSRFLEQFGIEVRYYNIAPASRFYAVQHRTHRKILAVDGEKVILGGRNIGDEYFDLHPTYNFLDSDVLVEGELVTNILASFDAYWESDWSASPNSVAIDDEGDKNGAGIEDMESGAGATIGLESFALRAWEQKVLGFLDSQNPATELSRFPCNDLEFVTDFPGSGMEKRLVYRSLVSLAQEVREEVVIESPYFVLRRDGMRDFKKLLDQGISIEVLTNSLYSTDAYYVISALFPMIGKIDALGLTLNAYTGKRPTAADAALTSATRWGVHSKRAVVDRKTAIIGTYNIDPRSANLNSELILICRNQPQLAAAMLANIAERKRFATKITGDGGEGAAALLRDSSAAEIVKTLIILPIALMLDFLL